MSEIDDSGLRGFLGVDTGGTFTDFCLLEGEKFRIHKVLSTPAAPERAILQGIQELGIEQDVGIGRIAVIHGSTVATNAALEGKGVKTAYVTNQGFADVLTLARQNRPRLYDLNPTALTPPVPVELCLEVDCRRDSTGNLVAALSEDSVQRLKARLKDLAPEAIAINLLYSFLCDEEEMRLEEALSDLGFVSRSSAVLPEYKEYERGMATWLNAWLGPKVAGYIQRLQSGVGAAPLAVMQSSGGTISASLAARRAVNLLLSGPAGGLAAARHIGMQIGHSNLLTFDMGGTSTDVALLDGDIQLTTQGHLGGYPVAVPMVDMHTIGAGGGSIAYIDSAGLLHVGPESSGADPGPACYGRGGSAPTVTDANVVLKRIQPQNFLGGTMPLDYSAAERAVGQLAQRMQVSLIEAAQGIIALANEHMVRALRVISVQKGFDPSLFQLCCFGGAGGLHVCNIAEALGVDCIIVPAHGGVLSAFGMLVAPSQRNLSKTMQCQLSAESLIGARCLAAELILNAESELREEAAGGQFNAAVSLDCRYVGQSFCLNIECSEGNHWEDLAEAFHLQHKRIFGHRLALAVELVNVRVKVDLLRERRLDALQLDPPMNLAADIAFTDLPDCGRTQVLWRDRFEVGDVVSGPAIICESIATTFLAPNWRARKDVHGHLHLMRRKPV